MAAALETTSQTRSASPAPAKGASRQRDIRLDVFRGLALLFITVTHTGRNWLMELLPSHFGFSSGTEMFVFCSGIASGLAFGALFLKRGFAMGMLRVAHRIWQIYWVHIASFIGVVALTMLLAGWFGRPDYVSNLQQDVLLTHPRQALFGLVTLTYLPPLFDILPLYVVLLAMIPLVMAARRLSPTLPFLLVGSAYVYLWTVGGPDLPGNPINPSQHWLFNPLGWQLLFFTGFFIAMKWLPTPAPGTPWALTASVTVLLASVPLSWHVLYENFGLFSYIREAVLPANDRSHFHLLRFVHFLAAAYLAVSLVAAYPGLMRSIPARILAMMGRETLAVFVASVPIAIVSGTMLDAYGTGLDIVLPVTLLGWAALVAVAYVTATLKARPWAKAPEPVEAAGAAAPLQLAMVGAKSPVRPG
ncbi:OpgC family protein [Labrys wisconsinensis]|uniref:OpgC domain-containing protein n=1 Tax=Labrys wisconsinensis TaxID=425677 RepID=A0ABU0JHI5_9HYPH|nr:OpgC domain-containing protein [Labrys wisconsinensis]MDQ0473755.1 hypothetical protein [Labrys wisconsinensis]